MAKLKYVWNSNVGKGTLPRSDPKVCREEEEAPPCTQRHNGAPWRQMVELHVRDGGGGVERPFKWELNMFRTERWNFERMMVLELVLRVCRALCLSLYFRHWNKDLKKINEVLNVTKTMTSHFAPCALIFLLFFSNSYNRTRSFSTI